MTIGYLAPLEQRQEFYFSKLRELAQQANSDIDISRYSSPDTDAANETWAKLRRFIEECNALIIPEEAIILRVPEFVTAIHERITEGCRVLFQINESYLEKQNAFLAHYDLTGTRTRIRSHNIPVLSLTRSAEKFRDFRLLAGVDSVEVQQPNAIWHYGESLPVLMASKDFLVNNGETDLPADWNAGELACVAAWHNSEGGGVLAMSGNYFRDPYRGATGVHWPGIEANECFANNVLTYLLDGQPPVTPEDRIQRIEINLVDFVLGILQLNTVNWWTEYVPLKIRQKCAQRQEEENNQLPKKAYFDLIDLKTLIQKNWLKFEDHLRSVGCDGGKEKSLAWLDKLNELRRLVGHPLKKHVSGYSFSDDEKDLIRQCDETTQRLNDIFRTSIRGTDSPVGHE
jgi:hypothetical protein